LRQGGRSGALPRSGRADLGREFGCITSTGGLQLPAAHFGPDRLLKKLGCRQSPLLHDGVEICRQVDLHARHTPIVHICDRTSTLGRAKPRH
jgi:hypothetical protein